MKRRNFLQISGAVGIPMLLNGMRLAAMPRTSLFSNINDDSDRVIVLIQLNGGNDGLNTIIPLDQYSQLFKARANILLPENSVLPITDSVGLHPVMAGMKSLFDDGQLGVVQSVAYPNQNRSHFRSIDIWTSGSPAEEYWNSGWLGRYLDSRFPGYPDGYPNEEFTDPFAITMWQTVSETCQGAAANFSMTLVDPFSLSPLLEGTETDVPGTRYGEELAFLRRTISQTNAYTDVITAAANAGNNMVEYPEGNELARQLKNAALLISGGLRTRVYIVRMGGFDTHANQVVAGDKTTGTHAELLRTLSEAVAAFQSDLNALGVADRVVGMTFSEFGRQIRSNDGFGTDHGTAAPLILFGSCVNPAITGDNPQIPDQVSIQEAVPMQFDFRDVYASLLQQWFGVSENEVRSLIHPEFQSLPLINSSCSLVTSQKPRRVDEPIPLHNYPNPFRDWTTISFACLNEHVRLSVFDSLGTEVRVLVNKRLPAGEHQITFEGGRLPSGPYFYRLQLGEIIKTMRMVKL